MQLPNHRQKKWKGLCHTMKAAVMTNLREITLQDYPMPQVGEQDVLVKVMHCGICGSDLHYFSAGRIGDYVVDKPMILGHECAGEVVEVGPGVKQISVGDRVAIEPGYTCGKCEFCKSGHYNLCKDVVFMATPPYDGAFCEYVSYPADVVYKLPPEMSTVEGALLEPLNVGFYAAQQGGASVGKSAAVLGAGCIGLCTVMALTAMGVREIYVVDLVPLRLEMAKKVGALRTIHAGEEDAVSVILEATHGRGVDMVFETAGSVPTGQMTVKLARRGGTVVMVGMAPNATYPYDFGTFIDHELTMKSVFRYRNLYPTAIDAVVRCGLPLKEIVTHYFDLEHTQEAMAFNLDHKDQVVKTVIEVCKE